MAWLSQKRNIPMPNRGGRILQQQQQQQQQRQQRKEKLGFSRQFLKRIGAYVPRRNEGTQNVKLGGRLGWPLPKRKTDGSLTLQTKKKTKKNQTVDEIRRLDWWAPNSNDCKEPVVYDSPINADDGDDDDNVTIIRNRFENTWTMGMSCVCLVCFGFWCPHAGILLESMRLETILHGKVEPIGLLSLEALQRTELSINLSIFSPSIYRLVSLDFPRTRPDFSIFQLKKRNKRKKKTASWEKRERKIKSVKCVCGAPITTTQLVNHQLSLCLIHCRPPTSCCCRHRLEPVIMIMTTIIIIIFSSFERAEFFFHTQTAGTRRRIGFRFSSQIILKLINSIGRYIRSPTFKMERQTKQFFFFFFGWDL